MRVDLPLLLISCSKTKHDKPGPAIEVYTGALTQLGVAYARKVGLEPLIISGKYGLITPETWIEPYESRRLKPLEERVYPAGHGYWLGDKVYFQKAPVRFQRLLPYTYNQSYGQQKGMLMDLLAGRATLAR